MKPVLTIFTLLIILSANSISIADVQVNGYYKKDGTYVQPHYRSDPNSTPDDNWSTKGNVNPYTNKPGYIEPGNNFNSSQPYNYQQNNQRSYWNN